MLATADYTLNLYENGQLQTSVPYRGETFNIEHTEYAVDEIENELIRRYGRAPANCYYEVTHLMITDPVHLSNQVIIMSILPTNGEPRKVPANAEQNSGDGIHEVFD